MEKPSHPQPKPLSAYLSVIADPRLERTREHHLQDILMISVLAMLCGAESFVDFEDFGQAKEEWLRTFLELPAGIPSHDTFGRVFAAIDPRHFSQAFTGWTQSLRKQISAEIVAIDGKSLRRSHRGKEGGPIHMVSAWAHENGLVLGQCKVDEKSNEITAIPELLRALELSGCIVSIDAMGCQKTIAKEILEADAHYVLALKGNQNMLHEDVKSFFEDARKRQFRLGPKKLIAHDYFETVEKDHGRIERRRYWVCDQIDWLLERQPWEGLRSIVMVESTRQMPAQTSAEVRYFISSLPAQARQMARAVRGHWTIENQLHWSLDVNFREDDCRIRAGYAAENMAILRHLSHNILKAEPTKKRGIKGKQKNAAWNHPYLLSLLRF